LRRLLPEPVEFARSLLRLGPKVVALGGEGANLGFEFGPSIEDLPPLALENGQAMPLFLEFLPSAPKPFAQRIKDSDEAFGVADGVRQDLVMPWFIGPRMLLLVVGIQYWLSH
jgi:hypothetical protein